MNYIPAQIRRHVAELQLREAEIAVLRARCQSLVERLPPSGALVLLPSHQALDKLKAEALARATKPDSLARQIIEQVALDDLFAAVLDT